MVIDPRPDQEATIQAAVQAGLVPDAVKALDVGIEPLRKRLLEQTEQTQQAKRRAEGRKSLAELFAESPFKGLNLEFERDKDEGRDIDL